MLGHTFNSFLKENFKSLKTPNQQEDFEINIQLTH